MIKLTLLILLVLSYSLLIACGDKEKAKLITVSDTLIDSAISKSDDYEKYKPNFISTTKELIQDKKCSISELKNIGGWVKSQNHKYNPIYFTYCGGMKINNKIYLNASTGYIVR